MAERPMLPDVETDDAAHAHLDAEHDPAWRKPSEPSMVASYVRWHDRLHEIEVQRHRHPSEPARDVNGELAGPTTSGHVLTEGEVEQLAAEAEAGYDVNRLLKRGAKLTRANHYPEVGKAEDGGSEIVQIVMHGSFYNAFFVPLLKEQDFGLIEFEGSEDEKEAGLRTFGMTFGESRAQMLKNMP